MSRMRWDALLSKARFSLADNTADAPPTEHQESKVSTFHEDIDRICYSAAFRRLQGKTQVLPFPQTDFTRTRLTHTIEVSNIGKQISHALVKHYKDRLLEDHFPSKLDPLEIADVVSAACLAHDLGNPPFGHAGEYAIHQWFLDKQSNGDSIVCSFFQNKVKAKSNDHNLTKTNDIKYFDGNAQGFRLLTRLQGWRNEGGLQLSHAVLSASSKYPYASIHATKEKPKFGYMFAERSYAEKIFSATRLVKKKTGQFARHPLAYIVEAADDIAYRTTDIEDATKDGVLSFDEGSELLKNLAESGNQLVRYARLGSSDYSPADRIAYLRAGAVSSLIHHAVLAFGERYDQIMTGQQIDGLLEQSKVASILDKIREISHEKIYAQRAKNEMELLGCITIETILDEYLEVMRQHLKGDGMSIKQKKLFELLPHDNKIKPPKDEYEAVLYIVDFVSSMTDRYAYEFFRKISGKNRLL